MVLIRTWCVTNEASCCPYSRDGVLGIELFKSGSGLVSTGGVCDTRVQSVSLSMPPGLLESRCPTEHRTNDKFCTTYPVTGTPLYTAARCCAPVLTCRLAKLHERDRGPARLRLCLHPSHMHSALSGVRAQLLQNSRKRRRRASQGCCMFTRALSRMYLHSLTIEL